MKLIEKLLLIFLAVFYLCACGPTQEDYDKLSSHVSELESKLDECQNGASRRISEIKDAFQKKDYDLVLSATEKLMEYHPGSSEAKEAEEIVSKVKLILKKQEAIAKKEAERKKDEEEKSIKDNFREKIRVSSVRVSSPNSAGGVDLYVRWQNRSQKIIKYATFSVDAYNAVNDRVSCDIGDHYTFHGQATGPVKYGQWKGDSQYWENAWWNHSIRKAKLVGVEIEYMDGSTYKIGSEEIKYILY